MSQHLYLDSDINGPWPADSEKIYFGMGCFWGAEKKLWPVPGVISTAVGYMGGTAAEPTYPLVCTGETGHAETVLVVYNPQEVNFYELLKVFWENHDPTQGDRQGNDIGTSYRSAMFYQGEEQKELFEKALERAALMWDGEIVTTLQPLEKFWDAEEYHQDYFSKNPGNAYCQTVVSGKMAKTRAAFTEYLK